MLHAMISKEHGYHKLSAIYLVLESLHYLSMERLIFPFSYQEKITGFKISVSSSKSFPESLQIL